MKAILIKVLTVFFLLYTALASQAATIQLPEWYRLEVALNSPPVLHKELEVNVSFQSLVGNIEEALVRLIIPDGWTVDAAEKKMNNVKAGKSSNLTFKITPTTYLKQGSIIAEASIKVPFADIEAEIKKQHPEQAEGMIEALKSWPAVSKRYNEISFALMAEETFYPLGQGMWLNYADQIKIAEGFRGPVYFDDAIITTHQAQTDVEMYEKLVNYSKADPDLEKKLAESGVDIEQKKIDQLNGLYVLATRMFIEGNAEEALNMINRFETEIAGSKPDVIENLEIAAFNLKGLLFWQMNQKRMAEDFLKKAFYRNRKNPLQRYVLRNIGLLMLVNGEKSTAQQMLDLALTFKTGYTQLEIESAKAKAP